MWKSQFNTFDQSIVTTPGSDITNEYRLTTNEIGEKVLTITGQFSQQDKINSYLDDCEFIALFKNIDEQQISALSHSFDVNDLIQTGIFDATKIPTSRGELFRSMNEARILFEGLPQDFREHFNYSYEYFYKQYGTQALKDYINAYFKVDTKEVVNE